jgi:two-component system sensor histidine kinase MprB
VSLRSRIVLAAGGAVALAVIAVAVSAYAGTRSQLRGQLDTQLRNLAEPIVMRAGGKGGGQGGGPFAGGAPPGAPFASAPSSAAALFEPNRGGSAPAAALSACKAAGGTDLGLGEAPGQGGATGLQVLITPSGESCRVRTTGTTELPVSARAKALAKRGTGQYFTDITAGGTPFREFLIALPGGRGAFEVALSLKNVNTTLSNELLLLAVIAASGIALAALLGIFVARTALGPIARLTRQAERIASHPDRVEHERLDGSGSDELARLGRTFNATLDALEASISAQRNLVADASHELRTPIATLRANLQLMRDEELLSPEDRAALRSDMIEELDELTKLVGDVVELARGAKPAAEPSDLRLDLIVASAIERAWRRAPQLTFEPRLEPTVVRGEGPRIDRAVTNLLDNASKWSPDGGVVDVVLATGTLTVRDHGPGFHDEDLPFVFDRFHRAKDARSKPGSGLGLAIVRQAAESHGGFVEAANADGGGAVIRISFGPPLELSSALGEAVGAP